MGLRLFASLSCLSMPKPILAKYSSVPPYVSLHIASDLRPQQQHPADFYQGQQHLDISN